METICVKTKFPYKTIYLLHKMIDRHVQSILRSILIYLSYEYLFLYKL